MGFISFINITKVNNDIHQFIEVKVDELSIYRQYPEL